MAGTGAVAGAAGQSGVGKLISGLGGIGGLLSVGSSIAGLLGGIGQRKRAKKALAEAEALNPGVQGYQAIANEAQQAARQGMSNQEYNLASTGIQRGTASALGAAGRLSNPIAAISNINRNQNDAFSQLNASNEAIKRQNRAASWQAQSQLQQARQRQYEDAYNAAQALMGAGSQNVAGSLGSLGQFGLMQSLYGDKTPNARRGLNTVNPGTQASGVSSNANPAFNPSDPLGLGKFGNPYQGVGGVVGRKFGGYGGPLGIGGNYYNSDQG